MAVLSMSGKGTCAVGDGLRLQRHRDDGSGRGDTI
jgi:hypothetical protein